MDINITLFVQMAQFWVVFYLLRRWLWRPALDLIQRDEEQQFQLEHKIATERSIIKAREEHREHAWQAYRDTFFKQTPSLQFIVQKPIQVKQLCLVERLTPEQQAATVSEIAQYIVMKVEHD